jgi:hypothetical protein
MFYFRNIRYSTIINGVIEIKSEDIRRYKIGKKPIRWEKKTSEVNR